MHSSCKRSYKIVHNVHLKHLYTRELAVTDLLLLTIVLFREFRRMIFLLVEEKKENEPPPFRPKKCKPFMQKEERKGRIKHRL